MQYWDGGAGAVRGVASGEVLGRVFGGCGRVEDCGGGRGGVVGLGGRKWEAWGWDACEGERDGKRG